MDTAQPFAAAETDPNAALEAAANAFKTATSTAPQERDSLGQFTAREAPEEDPEQPLDDDQPELTEEAEEDEDGAEEALEAHPMPPSWGNDDAELWASLTPEAQARIAEREGERDRAINQKFQEVANQRKAVEAAAQEAASSRQEYAAALDMLLGAIQPVKPDPRAYGAGTGQYNREAYDLALADYEQQANTLAQLQQQRAAIAEQEDEAARASFVAWKEEHEAQFAPKFLADVPDLVEPAKAEPLIRGLVDYAIRNGIPEDVFDPAMQEQITSAQLHLIWKAQQFDKLRSAKTEPKPKPAGPAVRPGVSSPRSAQKAAQRQRVTERLHREGSIEAGAAMFKQLFKG